MNIAILGYGSIARVHAESIRLLQETTQWRDLRLFGVMGRDPRATEAFAREFGMEMATTELDEILDNPRIDAVLVCSPTELHAEQVERSLHSGKHTLCEIPLATSLSKVDQLMRTEDESSGRLMICHTQRFYRGLMEAQRMIASGELHPHAIVGRQLRLRRENVNWKGRRRTWTDNLLWHHGCHSVDTALWLVGAADADVTAQVALPEGSLGIPMDLTIVARTPLDQILTVAMSYNSHFALHDYLVIGEETSLLWKDDELRSPDRVLVEPEKSDYLEDAVVRQDAEFFAAIQEQREPAVSARAVRPAMVVLQAVQRILNSRLEGLGGNVYHPDVP